MMLPIEEIMGFFHPLILDSKNPRQMDVKYRYSEPNHAYFFPTNPNQKIIAPEEGKVVKIERDLHTNDLAKLHDVNYLILEHEEGFSRIEHINPGLYVGSVVNKGDELGVVYKCTRPHHIHMYTSNFDGSPRKIKFENAPTETHPKYDALEKVVENLEQNGMSRKEIKMKYDSDLNFARMVLSERRLIERCLWRY